METLLFCLGVYLVIGQALALYFFFHMKRIMPEPKFHEALVASSVKIVFMWLPILLSELLEEHV